MAGTHSLFDDKYEYRDPSQQKRKNARVKITIDADFSVKGKSQRFPVHVVDIGTGGAGLETRTSVFEGDRIFLFAPINGKNMELESEVIRVSGKKANVIFVNLLDEDRELIQDLIHKKFFDKDKKPLV
ncbi:type IV pilus assembly protein PilZ [Leptospira broomii serovar Hurstbridge str. 5399]|uniref:Type IV pilus assembly protein PilZ n=1 Tax=Leptospira broomii serovar Hurstbridge str. 5399 TaxID=1049789 RepID=T0GDP2_9LEPT|nr:PilZ domain-containing protein [Leptospira broomii]EQA44939.1 type IV pilus assembly protein PilZ [Leptospira broomii serovar Hurstbridge str. 5399]